MFWSGSCKKKRETHYRCAYLFSHMAGLCLFKEQGILSFTFYGAFAKLRRAIISFFMSVCPSAWNNPAPTGQILMKFDIWAFFRKSVEKILVSLKSDRKMGTLHEDVFTFMTICRWILLRTRNVVDKCRENQNTHFMFNTFFPKIVTFMG